MSKKAKFVLFAVLFAFLLSAAALAAGTPRTVTDARSSVLRIYGSNAEEGDWIGTGFAVGSSDDIYIITNNHVAADSDFLRVYYDTDRYINADVVALDSRRDLAILKLQETRRGLNGLTLADPDGVQAGDAVWALGFPGSADDINIDTWQSDTDSVTITDGIVSSIRTASFDDIDYSLHARIIQTNTDINGGNSGGPLLNERGQVVGVNSFGMTDAVGINGSIFVGELRDFLDENDIPYASAGAGWARPVWWVWVLLGLAAAAVIGLLVFLIVTLSRAKKHPAPRPVPADAAPSAAAGLSGAVSPAAGTDCSALPRYQTPRPAEGPAPASAGAASSDASAADAALFAPAEGTAPAAVVFSAAEASPAAAGAAAAPASAVAAAAGTSAPVYIPRYPQNAVPPAARPARRSHAVLFACLGVAVLLCGVASAVVFGWYLPQKHAAALKQFDSYFSAGRYERAWELYESDRWVASHASDNKANYSHAQTVLSSGDFDEALPLFRQLGSYKDSSDITDALELYRNGAGDEADIDQLNALAMLNSYADCTDRLNAIVDGLYAAALECYNNDYDFSDALEKFDALETALKDHPDFSCAKARQIYYYDTLCLYAVSPDYENIYGDLAELTDIIDYDMAADGLTLEDVDAGRVLLSVYFQAYMNGEWVSPEDPAVWFSFNEEDGYSCEGLLLANYDDAYFENGRIYETDYEDPIAVITYVDYYTMQWYEPAGGSTRELTLQQ